MFKVDMHVHTHYSYKDGINSPEQMIRAAENIGLDGIAITDHDNIEGAYEAESVDTDLFIIKGCEVSSADGHILAYGINDYIKKGMGAKETIEEIHLQEGLAVAAHPFDHRRSSVGDLLFELPFDGVEALNGHFINDNGMTRQVCQENSFNMVAGTDAHMSKEVGSCYTLFDSLNDYKNDILSGATKVDGNPVSIFTLSEKWFRTNILRQGLFD